MVNTVIEGALVELAVNSGSESGAQHDLDSINKMYITIGLMYCLVAWGAAKSTSIRIRRFIHEHERAIEALIGLTYLAYAAKWTLLIESAVMPLVA